MIQNGFILNPDPYLLPSYRISPFVTKDVVINQSLSPDEAIDDYFKDRFYDKQIIYTENGRSAISIAINRLGLDPDDVVTILTTSSNFYISGCVTREIEKTCKWSRKFETKTKAIFVNHEFGFAYKDLRDLQKYNLPIIEDCAHSFLSNNPEKSVGLVGDFLVYSFPKFFPLQIGGLLVSKNHEIAQADLQGEKARYIRKVLSFHVNHLSDYCNRRRSNYTYLSERFAKLGMFPRFPLDERSIPGVFMFTVDNDSIDLPAMKAFIWEHGIQCSVFYGERAFFIPTHQALERLDLDYFYETVQHFMLTRGS